MSQQEQYPPNAGTCDKCGFSKTWKHRITNPKTGKQMPAHIDQSGFLLNGTGECAKYAKQQYPQQQYQQPAPQYQQPPPQQYPQQQYQQPAPQYQQPPPQQYQQPMQQQPPPQPQYQQMPPQPVPQQAPPQQAPRRWGPPPASTAADVPEDPDFPDDEPEPSITVFPVEALTNWLEENLAGPLSDILGGMMKELMEIKVDMRAGLGRIAETLDHWIEGEVESRRLMDQVPADEPEGDVAKPATPVRGKK